MKKYRYTVLNKIIYRYSNIPITFFLLLYLVSSTIGMLTYWYYFFFVVINIFVIYSLNKFFIKSYKLFPFEISLDNEKIVCADFFFSKKKIEINFNNIDNITGGIFSGYPTRPTYIHDSKQNLRIGFYANAAQFPELLKIIVQNINEDLYKDLLTRIKELKKEK